MELLGSLKDVGQEHVLKFYDSLDSEKKSILELEVKSINWPWLDGILKQTDYGRIVHSTKIDDKDIQQLPEAFVEGTSSCSKETMSEYSQLGLENVRSNNVAALLLAGGQGTRLGFDHPKGMYDIGLSSHMSLFQLQAERIKLLQAKASAGCSITWYIMTSDATEEETSSFFKHNEYFGLNPDNVVLFKQGNMPCFDFNGKVLLDEPYRLSRSPDGNGGIYEALHKSGIIDHMRSKGIKFVHAYCVDNVLVRVCDPCFMGYCITKDVDVGAKIIEKTNPSESVGTICLVKNKFKVIEYSEISETLAAKMDESSGKLAFNAGNICEHFFKVDFLASIKGDRKLPYHVAVKKIPHISLEDGMQTKPSEPNGFKLEKFIFDVFEHTQKFAAWQVIRDDEFSPVKNGLAAAKDNPRTALKALGRAYELKLLDV